MCLLMKNDVAYYFPLSFRKICDVIKPYLLCIGSDPIS